MMPQSLGTRYDDNRRNQHSAPRRRGVINFEDKIKWISQESVSKGIDIAPI